MFVLQLEKDLLNFSARIAHSNIRWYADIQEQISFLRSAAGAPSGASANSTQVDDRFFSAVCSFIFPSRNPRHHFAEQFLHPANTIYLFATRAKFSMYINP